MQTPKNLVENVRKAVEGDLVGYGCVGGNRMGIADGEDYEFSWDEDGNAHYMQESSRFVQPNPHCASAFGCERLLSSRTCRSRRSSFLGGKVAG